MKESKISQQKRNAVECRASKQTTSFGAGMRGFTSLINMIKD